LQRVARASEAIDALAPSWDHLPAVESDSLNALTDSLRAELREIEELWTTPKGFKGYDHVTRRMSDDLWMAFGRLDEREGPGANAQRAAAIFDEQTTELEGRVEAVFTGVWRVWVEAVEAVDRSPSRILEEVGRKE
jgi:hypothetical protein